MGGRTVQLACIIHKYCRALAGSFVRTESLVGCPYARLWSPSLEVRQRTKVRRNHRGDS